MRFLRGAALALAVALTGAQTVAARAADVTVFAAASLTDALNEIGKGYQHDTGKSVVF